MYTQYHHTQLHYTQHNILYAVLVNAQYPATQSRYTQPLYTQLRYTQLRHTQLCAIVFIHMFQYENLHFDVRKIYGLVTDSRAVFLVVPPPHFVTLRRRGSVVLLPILPHLCNVDYFVSHSSLLFLTLFLLYYSKIYHNIHIKQIIGCIYAILYKKLH